MSPENDDEFFFLDPVHTDPKRMKKEREKARELKRSAWWKQKLAEGLCHYCGKKFRAADLTMDHVVPLARGGQSHKGNLVPACKECNAKKKLKTPVDELFQQLEAERKSAGSREDSGE
jgi:5-methylcytosine-specific restriction protein A